MLELKVPRDESPRRLYWEADTFSYSYPLGKVNVKYNLIEKDKDEMLKKANLENDAGAKQSLADIVVKASAIELVFKLISKLGAIVRELIGWIGDIFNKPNIDKKLKELEKEMGKMYGDMKDVSVEMGKLKNVCGEIGNFTDISIDLKKLSNDMATLKKHFGVNSEVEKDHEQEENKGGNESVEEEKKKNGKSDQGEMKKKDKDEAGKDNGIEEAEAAGEETE